MSRLSLLKLNNLPIRYKLIIFFLLISILPAIGLGIFIQLTTSRIVDTQIDSDTMQLIGKVNKSLEFYMDDMQNITYFIASDSKTNQFLNESVLSKRDADNDFYGIRSYLEQFPTLYPEVAGIMIIKNNGTYISNELYTGSDVNLTNESWYKEAKNNGGIFEIIGHPKNNDVKNQANYQSSDLVMVTRSITDPNTQKLVGVVMIELDLRVIAETVKDIHLGKNGYLAVLDKHGDTIYSPEKPLISKIPLSWFGSNSSGNFSKNIHGQNLEFIYQKSPYTNWLTIGVFPKTESAFVLKKIRFYVITFVYIVIVLGITASLILANSLSKPIYELISFMKNVESNGLEDHHWENRKDEIGLLGQRYHKMLTEIKKWMKLSEEQSRLKREAELKSLQAHIKPHFLYNTLDTIHWMTRKRGAHDVTEVVEALSKLFRIGLSKGQDIIPLSNEIEHIESYLKIQKTRYQDKLNYIIDVSPEARQSSVLKIILQPIIENAIYHGIKERRGPGLIRISAYKDKQFLFFRVEDNGAGMDTETLSKLRTNLDKAAKLTENEEALNGYGILNVQARLHLHFGSPFGLYIESNQGVGTIVSFVHPWIENSGKGVSD
ncbi:sensor histidine kinase [Pullulanibacillus sp. KACC 23026]|uniref:cache domain-containing sensor histidine kinase n=1 Tax=Pullulanibacillus sp. KACC 23026 TaxID=3028315 RepID=UPI0023B00435|nr:sensor histidine kinase [Pullulanibacillus sp. KACC 23026]WEG12495.1 sensor histidine kinase [Pullulanibacillus sp. KACC 23026]